MGADAVTVMPAAGVARCVGIATKPPCEYPVMNS